MLGAAVATSDVGLAWSLMSNAAASRAQLGQPRIPSFNYDEAQSASSMEKISRGDAQEARASVDQPRQKIE
jgi:hypothetical protein